MKKITIKVLMFLLVFEFFSCQMQNIPEYVVPKKEPQRINMEVTNQITTDERKWTLMIYMAADNNLEGSALEDIYEMECSKLNTNQVTVLALVDRNPSYETAENNWSNTRLYRIETGNDSETKKIKSEQIECKELDLDLGKNTELDMSADYVLSNFISFSCKKFPAEHYGLIVWGHGTGWRSEGIQNQKAFAYDETSKNSMTLLQLGRALKEGLQNIRLDILGFDTCLGGELEVMYELKNYAKYCVASEGLIMYTGWNYESIFNSLQNDYSVGNFTDSIVNQFKEQYEYVNRASICVVKMDEVQELFNAFENYCKNISETIIDGNSRDSVMKKLYSDKNCKTEKYTYGTAENDVYLDIYSIVEQVGKGEEFFEAEKKAIVNSWASDRSKGSLGVYFGTLADGNLLSSTMPAAYTKGRTVEQIKFVQDSNWYVPFDKTGESLLDKLFFTIF